MNAVRQKLLSSTALSLAMRNSISNAVASTTSWDELGSWRKKFTSIGCWFVNKECIIPLNNNKLYAYMYIHIWRACSRTGLKEIDALWDKICTISLIAVFRKFHHLHWMTANDACKLLPLMFQPIDCSIYSVGLRVNCWTCKWCWLNPFIEEKNNRKRHNYLKALE